MALDTTFETADALSAKESGKEEKRKERLLKERGLMRRIAGKAAKLGAYLAVSAVALVGGIVVEQVSSPVQKTISGYMLKHERGTLAGDGIEGYVKRFLGEKNVPTLNALVANFDKEIHAGSIVVEDRNGVRYAELQHRNGRVREEGIFVKPVPLTSMSPYLVTAAVAAEDERFEHHYAWDIFSTVKAVKDIAIHKILGDKAYPRGASTIETQIADRLECPPTKESAECGHPTIEKKIREWLLATTIEGTSSKKEILETYLNLMYFGYSRHTRRHIVGVEAAAEHYFNKRAADLTLTEAALMVSMIKNPSAYGTRAYRDVLAGNRDTLDIRAWMGRAEYVVKAARKMQPPANSAADGAADSAYAVVTDEQLHETMRHLRYRKLPLFTPHAPVPKSVAFEYQEFVHDRLKRLLLPTTDPQATITVKTSLDLELQKKAREVLDKYVEKLRASGIKGPEYLNGSIVVLDTKTQDLLALVGGTGIEHGDYLNRTQSPISTGSAIKPLVAWMYLEHGGSMQDVFHDGPKTFKYPFGKRFKTWSPHNFKNRYKGNVTLEDATVDSRNSVYAEINVRLIEEVGADRIRHALALAGLDLKEYWPSTVLGAEVPPAAFAGTFSMLANGGMVHRYETGDANVRPIRSMEYENLVTGEQHERVIARRSVQAVSSPAIGQAVDHALREVVKRGTAKAIDIPGYDVRGKTGTGKTSFMFIGYEPALDKLVMVQFTSDIPGKTGTYSNRFTGGEYAVPAARELFEYLIQRETKM